jgi:hypothetical protein
MRQGQFLYRDLAYGFREPMADIAMDVQFIYNSASDSPIRIIGPQLDRHVAPVSDLIQFARSNAVEVF